MRICLDLIRDHSCPNILKVTAVCLQIAKIQCYLCAEPRVTLSPRFPRTGSFRRMLIVNHQFPLPCVLHSQFSPVWRSLILGQINLFKQCQFLLSSCLQTSPVQFFFPLMEIVLAHHKIHPFKIHNSVAFSIFMKSCSHPHCLIPGHFITPERFSVPVSSRSPFPSPQVSENHEFIFCLHGFPYSGYFIQMELQTTQPFLSGLFHQHKVFKAHLCFLHAPTFHSFLLQNTILSYGYTTFCLSIPLFLDIWVVSMFLLLRAILLQTYVYNFFVWTYFQSLGYMCRNGITGSYGSPNIQLFKEMPNSFPKQLRNFVFLHARHKSSDFSTSSSTLIICPFD